MTRGDLSAEDRSHFANQHRWFSQIAFLVRVISISTAGFSMIPERRERPEVGSL
jgi:hypothetical protein